MQKNIQKNALDVKDKIFLFYQQKKVKKFFVKELVSKLESCSHFTKKQLTNEIHSMNTSSTENKLKQIKKTIRSQEKKIKNCQKNYQKYIKNINYSISKIEQIIKSIKL